MKTVLTVTLTIAAMVVLAGAALAFMRPGHGPGGMGRAMMMPMGPQMMAQGQGPMGPGMHGGAMNATPVSEDQATAITQKYVNEQLKGFTISRVIPSTKDDLYRRAERPEGREQDAPHQPVRPRDDVPCAAAAGIALAPTGLVWGP